jgi:hypothetical protein
MKRSHKDVLQACGATLTIALILYAYHMTNPLNELPRNQDLPLFEPHRKDFLCTAEANNLPPLDAQADAWFREARALEDPSIFFEDRDYKKIADLTRKAAERRHWKAMLNLATYYLERRDPKHGTEDALQLVEEAMRMGVPAAYDRMGTYFMNGTGVEQDATRAYAFWQKAAELGNPDAMAYLSRKLNIGEDSGEYWSNIPIAIKMMECAFGQGNISVVYDMHQSYAAPTAADGTIIGDRNSETKMRALKILHAGVKLGCAECAFELWGEFDHPRRLSWTIAPFIDKARAERYFVLGNALEFNPYRRFPNLDKILPLPPAKLPPWDGTRESLLAAAMGVIAAPPLPPVSSPPTTSRYFLDPAYGLRRTGETTTDRLAPYAGYWRPAIASSPADQARQPALAKAGLYAKGEVFETIYARSPDGKSQKPISGVVWEYHRTIPADPEAVAPQAVPVLVRSVPPVLPAVQCRSDKPCTVGGIWQPWVADGHPLQSIVNQPWRQTWLRPGQPFPKPERDWLLKLSEQDVTWHLMERDDR